MWNTPTEARLNKLPKIYDQSCMPIKDQTVHLHFFYGGSDWYVTEYDGFDSFFGVVILNNDKQNMELGYFSFKELKDIKMQMGMEIDCEKAKFFPPQKIKDISNLKDWVKKFN